MPLYSLNTEEIKLIQEYRRITTTQQQAIIMTVNYLVGDGQATAADLPNNVFALIKRA